MSGLTYVNDRAAPEDYLPAAPASAQAPPTTVVSSGAPDGLVERILAYVVGRGYTFEPWQVAAYVTAVRTKPFVILAGISGTGKSKLPRLVAEATGADYMVAPVRPDWTDSSDLLGYERLDGAFRPGLLLDFARRAAEEPERQFFFLLDEMNIARVEYYLAEVLSCMEDRWTVEGRAVSPPLAPSSPSADGVEWSKVGLPDNLCIVGSVNMDETTFGFSKKVLDRAFVIEFSEVDLSAIEELQEEETTSEPVPSSAWRATALQLSRDPRRNEPRVADVIETLTKVNEQLELAQLQVGYRVRDEIAMFCLNAEQFAPSFVTTEQGPVDPLDLAVAMKVLPRIQGSGVAIRRVLDGLAAWASPETSAPTAGAEPGTGETTAFPFCGDRVILMLRRLTDAGFTNFWL